MKVFTYSEAQQRLAELLILAQSEEIEIKRQDGAVFSLRSKAKTTSSPFDVVGIKTAATTQDILEAIQSTRTHD